MSLGDANTRSRCTEREASLSARASVRQHLSRSAWGTSSCCVPSTEADTSPLAALAVALMALPSPLVALAVALIALTSPLVALAVALMALTSPLVALAVALVALALLLVALAVTLVALALALVALISSSVSQAFWCSEQRRARHRV